MLVQHLTIHGHDIAFRTAGRGPVLVLLHGMAGSSATWRHVMPLLAENFTLLAPDLLGHGDSAKPRADYSLGAYASTVRDLMLALGHASGTLVGQSFGGGVAMQMAYQHPEYCERLVLVGSGGLGIEVNALLRALSTPAGAIALPIGCRPLFRDLGEKLWAWRERRGKKLHASAAEIWRSYASLADPATRRAFMLTLHAVVDHFGQRVTARDRLYLASEVPTLIVWGTRDPIIPVGHARHAHEAIRGSRLELFDGVGHFPHCEQPERFARVLEEFVRGSAPARLSPNRWRELLTEGRDRSTRALPHRPAGYSDDDALR
jgi:pimeloyl-ACP methyl ester carboxylesterase